MLPLLALAASLSTVPTSDQPIFLMTVDETGRAVCSGPTEQQRIVILDHLERLREEEALGGLDLDYLVDSSETVTLQFRGVPRAAREAIWHAMDIWFSELEITVPFTLRVYWEEMDMEDPPLAFAQPYWDEEEGEAPWACSERVDWGCRPKTLVNQLSGRRLNGEFDPDPEFEVHFHEDHNWYLGTDGNPGRNEFDLVTVMLHEIGHTLGFMSGFSVNHDRRTGEVLWDDSKWSVYYDQFVWGRLEGDLLSLNSPSRSLYNALTSNRIFWGRSDMKNWHEESLLSVRRNGGPVMLWATADTSARPGQHVSHLDEEAFPFSHSDNLMTPIRYWGEAKHHLGPVTLGMLYDLGWDLKNYRGGDGSTGNPDAVEMLAILRWIGSQEGDRSLDHLGILVVSKGAGYGLFGVNNPLQALPFLVLYHADPINSRSATIHMKADSAWAPHLVISAKNEPAPEPMQDEGLEYSTSFDLTGSDFQDFLKARDRIELHIHFAGDTRRTILTFPLREPIR